MFSKPTNRQKPKSGSAKIKPSSIKSRQSKEQIQLWCVPEIKELELMHATFTNRSFPKHTHDGFGIGLVENGALGFYYRGENVVAPSGAVSLVNPDEVHTGQPATEAGWRYRMFYFNADLMQKAASEIGGRSEKIPFFPSGVIFDNTLARTIYMTHRCLEKQETTTLEKETRFLLMLCQLITKYADDAPVMRHFGKEHRSIKGTKEYIQENYSSNISINDLASKAKLSPFHFINVFRQQVGLPPHAYLLQVKTKNAKNLIKKGWHVSDAALEAGFFDQSHLTRNFKRFFGFTPGQYRNFVQDSK